MPDPVRESVEFLVAKVRAESEPGRREVRWVRLDGLHVTLRFLGPTPDERIGDVAAAVSATASSAAPFEAGLDGAGAFPDSRRPRGLWLGIGIGARQLAELAAQLGDELAERGWPRDERPFRCHLTLARSDGVATGPATVDRLVAAAATLRQAWAVDRIGLYESVTGHGPARYDLLEEARFGGTPS